MTSHRALKQWSLSWNETITSIDAWENNLKYIPSLDLNFADYLTDGLSLGKKCYTSMWFLQRSLICSSGEKKDCCSKGNTFGNDAQSNCELCPYHFPELNCQEFYIH